MSIPYLHRCLKELVFEGVRASMDLSLPSRGKCIFLFEHEVVAADSEALLGRDPGRASLLAIRPMEPCRVLRAARSLLDLSGLVPDYPATEHAYSDDLWAERRARVARALVSLFSRYRVDEGRRSSSSGRASTR